MIDKDNILRRFDLWLGIKYYTETEKFIKELYKSEEYSKGFGMAMTLISGWLNDFSKRKDLPSLEVLEDEWKKVFETLGSKK